MIWPNERRCGELVGSKSGKILPSPVDIGGRRADPTAGGGDVSSDPPEPTIRAPGAPHLGQVTARLSWRPAGALYALRGSPSADSYCLDQSDPVLLQALALLQIPEKDRTVVAAGGIDRVDDP